MDSDKKMSRGEFLGALGGLAITAVLYKFSGARKIVAAVSDTQEAKRPASSAYGNYTYGGKRS